MALQAWTDVGQSRVKAVIEQASRRSTLVLVVEHSAFALVAVLGGFILLLLLGTQILDWPWLVLVAVLGGGVAAERIRKRRLSRYRVAQIVDHHLSLNDSLSTAWFLLEKREERDGFAREQVERAEAMALDVKPACVFPYVWRRAWALTLALAGVAFGLFATRYLVTRGLSLKQALIPHPLSLPAEIFERMQPSPQPGKQAGRDQLRGANTEGRREADGKRGEHDNNEASAAQQKAGKPGENNTQRNLSDPETHQLGARQSDNQADRSPNSGQNPDDAREQQGKAPASAANRDGQPQQENRKNGDRSSSPGLMDQMKDALSGLMAKMRQQSPAPGNQDHGQQNVKAGQQARANSARNPQAQPNTRNSQNQQTDDPSQTAQGQQQAQASEKSPTAQSQAADESSNSKSSDSQSGIGRQDGEKTLRAAEQLRAMGKLDEIIGKRSSTLTGDMVVETHSGQQRLQTQYSGRVGHHADLGGEIDRDEVPVALQQYVREYMEQVRKQANNEP